MKLKGRTYHFYLRIVKGFAGKFDYVAEAEATDNKIEISILATPHNLWSRIAGLICFKRDFLAFESSSMLKLVEYLIENSRLSESSKKALRKELQPEDLLFVMDFPKLSELIIPILFSKTLTLAKIEISNISPESEFGVFELILKSLNLLRSDVMNKFDISLSLRDALNLIVIYDEMRVLQGIRDQLEAFSVKAMSSRGPESQLIRISVNKEEALTTLQAIDGYIIKKRKCPGCLKPVRQKFETALASLSKTT